MSKTCPSCGEHKPLSEFYNSQRNRDKRDTYCKACRKARALKWGRDNAERARARATAWRIANPDGHRDNQYREKYGLTLTAYDLLLEAQGGVCAVCGGTDKRKLAVDHCHTTGRVRGLLCHACNTSLGLLAEDPTRIRQLAAYIELARKDSNLQPPL